MFHHQTKFAIVFTIFMFYSTKAINNNCERSCGKHSLKYPFGFSSGCEIQLNCAERKQVQIGELKVQNVTSDSIYIRLPAKCNRRISFVDPLFGKNFAPTRNNSFLVQRCSSHLGGCVIPTSIFFGSLKLEGCEHKRSEDINCLTMLKGKDVMMMTHEELKGSGCKFLFSAIAVDKSKELSLQFQVVELGWWLEGPCHCSNNETCTEVHLAGGKQGFRCHCREGFTGDGFIDGTGCRRVSHCNASTLNFGECGRAIKIGVLVGVIIVGASLVAALFLLCYFTKHRSTWLRKQVTIKRLLREAAGNSSVPFYPYKEIERATDSFSEKHRLGTGAFGTVYAGNLHNDEWVAVKKIKHRDTNSVDQVMNEIRLLSSVSHPNLVRLLGCCIEDGEQILVYEYMPNGTLSQHLQRERGEVLPWTIRLTVATETANAIAYLHSAIDPPIYHRDIKSSNILLDYSFQSKVADFGLSRLGMTENSHISTAPQGTPGYVDPQYHQNFYLSDKSDVYSFGVVLLEIITAMKVIDFARPQSEVNLATFAVDKIRRGCVDEIIDPFLEPHRDAWTLYSVLKVAELAFRCLAFHSDMRPTMMEVAEELEQNRWSGWATMEETICMASSVESACLSPRNGSEKSLSSIKFKREGQVSETLTVPKRTDICLHSMEEVKESSPVSVQDNNWLSEPSSPSTNTC
ncbi:PREDICTED: wall-associated receptor kinase-like 14 [Lupinus angustifolius]|uniref:wall-associated receptor kinase-like 14 n=1 Tax=Lupinus angustifolius TaxID=3871 RepID=UPI00092F9700|nr:PREDICTED: wall-associated receptor kinase-like 14 [Lupinus angustifolius]XP_019446757.1 PREDICTED: wall-associated receptor kinase-like 14 [Lupinus angustifolius]